MPKSVQHKVYADVYMDGHCCVDQYRAVRMLVDMSHALLQTHTFSCRAYADMVGEETAAKYQTPLFLVASASAEVIADIALCPWEAVKVWLTSLKCKCRSSEHLSYE